MSLNIVHTENLRHALDLSFEEWKEWCILHKMPAFAGNQIVEWIYRKGVLNPQNFTNISPAIRNELTKSFRWNLMRVDSHLISKDTSEKFLLKTDDDLLIEMVLMPSDNRITLCISCQVGCRMGCTFCQTGKMGLKRNLTSGEILSQLHLANETLASKGIEGKVSNIVYMGMGEPLDNYDEVVKACTIMISPKGYGLSKSRVTVSTSGLVPAIEKLGRDLPVRLAISLHTADNTLRSKMMPINRTYSLEVLKEALLRYPAPPRHGITFEYVMIEGVNDSIADAKKLVSYIHGLKVKVNLIPLNHFPGVEMSASSAERLRQFQMYLSDRSIPAPVRYSRGQDVSGGCGQLAAKHENELDMDPRELHRNRRQLARSEPS